jgi:hypothetical protein
MVTVMLCGASDTKDVSKPFHDVTHNFGGEPQYYQTGEIQYSNHAAADWEQNSELSVKNADVCVFVILRDYGKITWNIELASALNSGIPFLILCLSETYNIYQNYRKQPGLFNLAPSAENGDENVRNLIKVLGEIEGEKKLTVVPFESSADFAEKYQRELSKLFKKALHVLSNDNKRQVLLKMLNRPEEITSDYLDIAKEIALNELADKQSRKRSILVLVAKGGTTLDNTLSLLNSQEQGVQRLAAAELLGLCKNQSPDDSFFEDCVEVVNKCDDWGLTRRLIPSLLDLELQKAIDALEMLDLSESIVRRKLAKALEEREDGLRSENLIAPTISLLNKCAANEDSHWLTRCRTYLRRLEAEKVE